MNTKMKTLLFSLASLWLFNLYAFGQQPIIENNGERAPVTKEAAVNKPPQPASLRLADAIQRGQTLFSLDEVSAAQIAAADEEAVKARPNAGQRPARVGMVRPVSQTFGPDSFVNVTPDAANERKAWAMALRSPGALGIRLRFVNFDVGDASVLVYARNGDEVITLGPFSGKGPQQNGDFWTLSLPGDTAFIEFSGDGEPRLEIAEVMHYDKDPAATVQKRAQNSPAPGSNQANAVAELGCHLDVMQENVDTFARDATGWIAFRQAGGGLAFVCTGTLLNDLDGETFVPYFLTANHCGITANNINSVEVRFLFQRNPATGIVPSVFTLPGLAGGSVLAENGGNDMTFIRLNGAVPAGVTLAGWSTGGPPNGSFSIHHPGGTFKRATFFDPNFYLFCPFTFDPNYWVVLAQRGALEPGSSGSGLFDPNGRLIGQYRGRCGPGTGANGNCSTDAEWRAVHGKFSVTHGIIRRWLEIGGTIHVDRNFTGPELGTPSQPFRTVTAAYNFAWDGARIKVRAGSYPETLALSKRVTILAESGAVTIGR